MTGSYAALDRLFGAAADGRLDALCDQHHVRLLGAFGSVIDRDHPSPRDLDLAVAFAPGGGADVVSLWSALSELCGPVELDLMDLRHARPVARAHGLAGLPLYERTAGEFAREQMAASLERMDTAWLRSINLELLAS